LVTLVEGAGAGEDSDDLPGVVGFLDDQYQVAGFHGEALVGHPVESNVGVGDVGEKKDAIGELGI
jgi:hypothetical protein